MATDAGSVNPLYYGRLTPLWSELLQQYHPQINSRIYLAKVITLTWQAMLRVWKLHNDHLHLGNPDQEDCSQLQATVHQIFFEAWQDPQLQVLIKNLDPNQIMSCPTCHIQQWVTNSHNHMQAHMKVVKLQACLQIHNIHEYFPWCTPTSTQTTTDKDLLCPP